jgi:hypothetical protein
VAPMHSSRAIRLGDRCFAGGCSRALQPQDASGPLSTMVVGFGLRGLALGARVPVLFRTGRATARCSPASSRALTSRSVPPASARGRALPLSAAATAACARYFVCGKKKRQLQNKPRSAASRQSRRERKVERKAEARLRREPRVCGGYINTDGCFSYLTGGTAPMSVPYMNGL